MKIVVTGGAGMIGSNLSRALIKKGHDVIVLDNLWRGSLKNIQDLINESSSFEFIHADLSLPGDWQSCLSETDCIFHLADIVAGIGYVFSNEAYIFRKNLLINSTVASACELSKVKRYVYVGTACSFPLELQTGVDAPPLKESDQFPANPESAYGWSKLMGELDATYMAKNGIDSNVLILHNVYGSPCDFSSNRAQAIPALAFRALQASEGNKKLTVWGDGEQGRAFIHVDDVVNALVRTLDAPTNVGPIQIGPSECTSIKSIAENLIEIIDKDIEIEFDLTKPIGDKGRCADFSKANKILGWAPRVSIQDGLVNLVNWIKRNS